MSRPVRVRDLPDRPEHGVMLICAECFGEFSACRGDYFLCPPDQVMTHHDEPMQLMRKRTVFERVPVQRT